MQKITKSWIDFKALISAGMTFVEHDLDSNYELFGQDGNLFYVCELTASADITDYETNYQANVHTFLNHIDDEGRPFLRAESKPTDMTTYFTTKGDISTEIGGGAELKFNFNNTDDDVTDPPTGFKQKKICCSFIDIVRLKEGTVYWENMPFGSHIDLCLGVEDWDDDPTKGWYLKNDGTPAQNKTGEPLMIAKFVNDSPMMGDCAMGDEMNTEAASNDIPAGTIFGILVTVPSSVTTTDNVHGAVVMELYRKRTVIL